MTEMVVDAETEEQLAADTGHELGCLEWGLEVLLEQGVSPLEVNAVWLTGGTGCWCPAVRELAG
ncbi:MAG: hypothetical protein ABWY81_06065 [Jiangellaceae bacterium]